MAWAVLIFLCVIIGAGVSALSHIDFDGQWADSLTQLTQKKDVRDAGSAAVIVSRRVWARR